MGLCAQTPGAYCGTGKGVFLYSHSIPQWNAILHIEKNIIFLTFSIYFSKKIGFMEKIVQKRKKFRLAILK